MNKKIIIFTICILCFIVPFCSCISFADNEISNNYEYIDTSVYHTFINYLVSHDGDKYSRYINNMHCTILKTSLNDDYYGKFSTYGGYASYLNINSFDEQSKYNQNTPNNNVQYLTYIAFFTSKPLTYSEIDTDFTYSGNNYHFTENLNLQDGELYFVMCMTNNLNITIYPFRFNTGSSVAGFNYNSGTHLVYTDDTIYYNNSSLQYSQASNSNSDLFDFEITENENVISLYQKIMALYNNQFNTYARIWSEGDKPTIAIFDNSSTNSIIPLLDSNNYIQNKYIAVFSTCRLCEYDQNNNSRHFNSLTYGNEFLHIITFDEGLNNYNFYNLMSRNYQNDVITLTGISGDELLFCNSNIIQKSDANNFIVGASGQLTYFYYSNLELLETYPVNNISNNNSNNDNSVVWQEIVDSINNSSTSFNDTMNEMIDNVYDTSSEFITDTATPFFNNLLNTISNVVPFNILLDFIRYIRNLVDDAIIVKNKIVSDNGFVYSFTFLNKTISFNPFYYFFSTNLYSLAQLFCNLSFFSFIIIRIYKDIIFILSEGSSPE